MTKRAKLDKTRSYGVVYGDPGVAYEQDNKQFNAVGDEVGDGAARPATAQQANPVAGGLEVEHMPLDAVTMAQLRARYTEVTGGKKAKVGLNKTNLQAMIRDVVAA